MSLEQFIRDIPKVELHVHLEGSTQPETLLKIAKRHGRKLPADTVEGLREWYKFKDFPHFAEIYWTSSECFRHPDDIEEIAREFLVGQKAQNIVHSEVTYTPLTIFRRCGLSFRDQLDALNRGIAWGQKELGISMTLTIDIPREACTEEESLMVADWAIEGYGSGVSGFGLGGYEVGFPPEMFAKAFERARAAGLPSVPHAGETEGAASIRGSLDSLGAVRIGHGIRCLEDPVLVEKLRQGQIPLEVCPSSNVRLNVVPDLAVHPLPKLMEAGLYVTLNSDDPPMFGTTLTDEYLKCAKQFGWDEPTIVQLVRNAIDASFLDVERKEALHGRLPQPSGIL